MWSFPGGYYRTICAPRTIHSKPHDFKLKTKNWGSQNQINQVLQSDLVWTHKWPFQGWKCDLHLGNHWPVTFKKRIGTCLPEDSFTKNPTSNRNSWPTFRGSQNFFLIQGLHLPYRLAVQLGPQLLILLPYLPRILRYIAAIPSYEPSAGELRLAEMESLKKVVGGPKKMPRHLNQGWSILT